MLVSGFKRTHLRSSLHEYRTATLRLFPGITVATVHAFLTPPIQGVILETFGKRCGYKTWWLV